jgi:hypothetical protein
MGCKAPFLANSPRMAKKSNATGCPSPPDHRPQGVMQRVPRVGPRRKKGLQHFVSMRAFCAPGLRSISQLMLLIL